MLNTNSILVIGSNTMKKKPIVLSEDQKIKFTIKDEGDLHDGSLKKYEVQKSISFKDNEGKQCIKFLNKEDYIKYLEDKCIELKDNGTSREHVACRGKLSKLQSGKTSLKEFGLLLYDIFHKKHQIKFLTESITFIERYANNKCVAVTNTNLRGLKYFLQYLENANLELESPEKITQSFMIRFCHDAASGQNFDKSMTQICRQITYYSISTILKELWRITGKSFKVPALPEKSTLGTPAYNIALSKVFYAFAWIETQDIIKKYKQYMSWKKVYEGEDFYSMKNLAFTYLRANEKIRGYNKLHRFLERVSLERHRISLRNMPAEEMKKLAQGGVSVNKLNDEETVVWFLESVLPDYPYKGGPLRNYASYFPEGSLAKFVNNYGALQLIQKVLFQKLPYDENVYPFFLFFLGSTGNNLEVMKDWKWESEENGKMIEIGEEQSPIDSSQRIIWGDKKRSKKYIMTVLDKKEKNGLWDMLIFLREFLKPLSKNSKFFWNILSKRDYKATAFGSAPLRVASEKFCKKYEFPTSAGVLKYIEHRRMRPTRVAMAVLKGKSMEEIKEHILNHKDIDTSVRYTNSEDVKDLGNVTINAMQESMFAQARIFVGNIDPKKVGNTVFPANGKICSDSSNPTYQGHTRIKSQEVCINYDNCYTCKHANIFDVHVPNTMEDIRRFAGKRDTMNIPEWELNYGAKYAAAIDCLKRHAATDTNLEFIQSIEKFLKEETEESTYEIA